MRFYMWSILALIPAASGAVANAAPRRAGAVAVLPLTASDLATESAAFSSRPLPDSTIKAPEESSANRTAPPQAEAPQELVLTYRERNSGAQVELGALGGGRAEAPSLLHIGVGLDF